MSDNTIHMQSGVSAFTGQPFVELHWGEMHGQLTPEEAIKHALAVIETAEAALSDAFLFNFARDKVGTPPEGAAQMLVAFRGFRGERPQPPQIPEAEK